ncbi:MAG: NAD(+) diphosphatase [Bacteroidaceae bacterium]|nr:NAD(+) diphosphatase [Bacteroidaceae bacterium]
MYWIIFHNDQLLLQDGALPRGEMPPIPQLEDVHVHTLPNLDGESCKAFAVTTDEDEALCSSLLCIDLRASYDLLPLAHYLMAGKAKELMHFDATVRYCSVCGAPMHWHTEISKMCHSCKREVWPSIATAIIVLITRGDEVLLVRARNFRRSYYGLVAGFLETGETLEECVRREVKEETNLEVKNIRYFGNQPWPYPSGQMVGFTAEYAGGELCVQDEELTAASFFRYDNLPEIPHKLSMARMLIDAWLEGYQK